jgi:hypothetical protein
MSTWRVLRVLYRCVGIAHVCKHGRGVRSDIHKVDMCVVRSHSLVPRYCYSSILLCGLENRMRVRVKMVSGLKSLSMSEQQNLNVVLFVLACM